jgi:predicted lipoprotein with Yx(FWY)xxD motif
MYRSRRLNLAAAGGRRAARPGARPRLPRLGLNIGLRIDAGPRDGGVGLRARAGLNPPPGGDVYWFMETSVKAPGRHQRVKAGGWLQLGLRVAGAVLLAVSAGIHLDLYLTGYRSIPTIGWLFLLQVIAGFVLAAAVVVMRSPLVAAAGAGFALATLGGYLLSVQFGLFGFKEVRTAAGIAAGLIEVAAFAVLALAAITAGPVRQAGEPASPAARMLARVQAAAPMLAAAVGAVSVAALALLGVAVASAGGQPAAPAGAPVTVKTAAIGGVRVLTDASGLTLYWFAPDTPAASKCTGSCAAYWPPVTGSPRAGPGVTGRLGTITRPGGAVQATYDGHPLYTYIGDSGPGQARGNDLNLNGGLWYEVRASG